MILLHIIESNVSGIIIFTITLCMQKTHKSEKGEIKKFLRSYKLISKRDYSPQQIKLLPLM